MTELAGREITVEEMTPLVVRHFQDVFDVRLDPATTDAPALVRG